MAGCSVDQCDKPHKRKGYCYSHYMKWWRYGDPLWVRPKRRIELVGSKFGTLTVTRELDTSHWECTCECGRITRVRTWSLTSGGTVTCGDGPAHHRAAVVGYSTVHQRLVRDRGDARDYSCADCGLQAAHWSYDHSDPVGLFEPGTGPYSLDQDCYLPRCAPCHRAFDLSHSREAADA